MSTEYEKMKQKYEDIEAEMHGVRFLWVICNSIVFAYIVFLVILVLYQRGIFNKCCRVSHILF